MITLKNFLLFILLFSSPHLLGVTRLTIGLPTAVAMDDAQREQLEQAFVENQQLNAQLAQAREENQELRTAFERENRDYERFAMATELDTVYIEPTWFFNNISTAQDYRDKVIEFRHNASNFAELLQARQALLTPERKRDIQRIYERLQQKKQDHLNASLICAGLIGFSLSQLGEALSAGYNGDSQYTMNPAQLLLLPMLPVAVWQFTIHHPKMNATNELIKLYAEHIVQPSNE